MVIMINNMRKTVMIHEVTPDVLKKDLSDFDIITFDDGLYSQYLNLKHFIDMPQPKYFFISTDIVCPEDLEQSTEAIYCADAHQKAFKGDFENYMKWSQILEIYNTPNCFIGGHSHKHTKITSLTENVKDTNKMMEIFKSKGIKISSYCYPYNYFHPLRKISVNRHGITNIFGGERIPIETL
jgi:hypothetical protein